MLYFNQDDYTSLIATETGDLQSSTGLQTLHQRLAALQQSLIPRFKNHEINLHPAPNHPGGISQQSASTPIAANVLTLTLMRPRMEAKVVESMMGRDELSTTSDIEAHRHPVIELRLTPDYFAIELVISPDAWYDQQNLIGKLSIKQHRNRLYHLLSSSKADYLIGFWRGVHLDDTHLSTAQLPPAPILFEYLETFADRRDWLRVGHWYTPDNDALQKDVIVKEVVYRVQELYQLYTFVAWSNKNNFHSLYRKSLKHSKR